MNGFDENRETLCVLDEDICSIHGVIKTIHQSFALQRTENRHFDYLRDNLVHKELQRLAEEDKVLVRGIMKPNLLIIIFFDSLNGIYKLHPRTYD